MLKYESYTEDEIRVEAENFAEDADLPIKDATTAINIYLNSKPGTWKLVSHCQFPMFGPYTRSQHQFIWSTGEE